MKIYKTKTGNHLLEAGDYFCLALNGGTKNKGEWIEDEGRYDDSGMVLSATKNSRTGEAIDQFGFNSQQMASRLSIAQSKVTRYTDLFKPTLLFSKQHPTDNARTINILSFITRPQPWSGKIKINDVELLDWYVKIKKEQYLEHYDETNLKERYSALQRRESWVSVGARATMASIIYSALALRDYADNVCRWWDNENPPVFLLPDVGCDTGGLLGSDKKEKNSKGVWIRTTDYYDALDILISELDLILDDRFVMVLKE